MNKRKLTRRWHSYYKHSKYLYLITNGHFYKLGITKDVDKRVKEIQSSNAHPVKLVKFWEFKTGEAAWKAEGYLLEKTSASPAENEWFEDNRCRDLIIRNIHKTLHLEGFVHRNVQTPVVIESDNEPTKRPDGTQLQNGDVWHDTKIILLIFLFENFKEDLNKVSSEFLDFLRSSKKPEIELLKEVLLFTDYEESSVKETPLYAKAMMLGLNFTKEEALIEFIRVSDQIRLEYDELFTDFLINLAKKRELTAERKENLQKQISLRDNNSVQEEILIDLLNDYS